MDSNASKLNTIISSDFVNKMNLTDSLLDRNKSFAIMLGSFLLAILFGLISATGDLLVISIAVAFFAGVFLLARPLWIVWFVLSMGMLVVGVVPIFVEGVESKAGWTVCILCFFLMLLALFKAITSPNTRKGTPSFIWLMIGFFVYAVLNTLIQLHSAEEFIGGFKRYFLIWGLMFALCWMAFDQRHIRRWRVFFLIVALVQLPFVIYERIVLVPLREGVVNSFPGMVPIDVVSGTFGVSLFGGGASGDLATFLIIVLAFLLALRREKELPIGRLVLLTLWVLAPLFLGETKAVIIMLPLMYLVLARRELLTSPHFTLMALIIGALLTVGIGFAYVDIMQKPLDKIIADTLSYNLYEKGYAGGSTLNRTTVLTFWANHQGAHDPVSFVFGNGLGSSHEATGGHVDNRYPNHLIGLTAASTLLWDMGVFGCGLFIAIFASAWSAAGRLYRESTEPMIRADAAAIQAALSLFVFHLFYSLSLLETPPLQIVFAALLGYLAWLYRRHSRVDTADSFEGAQKSEKIHFGFREK